MPQASDDPVGIGCETAIIVNPAAHNLPSRKRLQEVDCWLVERGWKTEWSETAKRGDATRLAAEAAARGAQMVFVCGGDGTLNEAANGLAGSETALATIPAGTVNIWAREVGISRKPLLAVKQQVDGDRRRIDLGKAGGRHFLLMAGYGLDGAIARRVSQAVKGRVGAAAYAIAAVREALTYRASPLTLRLDGDELRAEVLMVVAGNTRSYGGVASVTADAKVDDGLLDVCVYEGRGTVDIVLHVLRTALRRHRRSRKVLYKQVQRLELEWETPLLVQLDGDAYEESPSEVTVARDALWVMVPRGFRGPLFSLAGQAG